MESSQLRTPGQHSWHSQAIGHAARAAGWSALVAFSGIGDTGKVDVSKWLADLVKELPANATFSDLLSELTTATKWLRTVPADVERRHTFSVAGFEGTKPVVALVSNYQSIILQDLDSPQPEMMTSRTRPREPRVFLGGSGAAFVTQESKDRLIGMSRSGARTNEIVETIAEINAVVSRRPGSYVSERCFVAWASSSGAGGGRPFALRDGIDYVPEFLFPKGIRLRNQTVNGIRQPIRLVQMAFQRSEPTEQFHQEQLRTKPNDASVLNNYAAFLLDVQKQPDRAQEVLRQALVIDPNESNALGNYANILSAKGELDTAEEFYKRSLESNPSNTIQRQNYCNFLATSRNNPDAAKAILEEGIKCDPNNSQFFRDAAAAIPDEEQYLLRIAERPDDPDTHCNYGVYLHCVIRDPSRGEEEYRKALALNPNHVNANGNLAVYMMQHGLLDEAQKLFIRTLQLDPANVVHRNNYAEFLMDERKDATAAREVYENGLAIHPESPTFLTGIRRLDE